jgi:hypothetical protein
MLSTGVTSGGTRRSLFQEKKQLFQVDDGIQVAVDYQPAVLTPILALLQSHPRFDLCPHCEQRFVEG